MLVQKQVNYSPLFSAIENNNLYKIQSLLKDQKEYFRYINKLGESLIHIAVQNNFKELIQWLISEGFDIDSIDYTNRTALHLAVAKKNEDMIKYLLLCKASTTLKDLYGKSPFHMIIESGDLDLVKLFLRNGANVLDVTLKTHETAFHLALNNENMEVFKLLLVDFYGDINVTDIYQETPLHIVARQKNNYLIKLLLDKEADLNMVNKDNETALHFAIHHRNFSTCELLIQYGANVNTKNKYQESPLHLAIRYKDIKLVNLLLINNADVNVRTKNNESLLHVAINYYHKGIMNLLLKYGIHLESRNSQDLNPFHLAIKRKCLDGARILLNKGASVNSVSFGKFGGNYRNQKSEFQMYTPLHTAIIQKDFDGVTFLLENGASFNNDYEIFLAVESGCPKIVEQIIKHGGNVNAVNNIGQSLLYKAMKIRNKEEVKLLLQYGANKEKINETGCENETALHLAVKAQDEKFVRFLLEININVNICNANNFTALYFATGCTPISNRLLAHIALLKVNNQYVNKQNESLIETVEDFKMYFLSCSKELHRIKNERLSTVVLLDFLTKDISVLSKYLKRKEIIASFQELVNYDKYPIYYTRIVENMSHGIARSKLAKTVKTFLDTFPYFGQLYDVLDNIIDNFSNDDLQCLIKNCNLFDNKKLSRNDNFISFYS